MPMHYTIEQLIAGNRDVADYYRRAVERWQEIWSRPESNDIRPLGIGLPDEQEWFEKNCGGGNPRLGQEIMVVAGLGMLYSSETGFDGNLERARLLYNALQRSFCSLESKVLADELAKAYGLFEVMVG